MLLRTKLYGKTYEFGTIKELLAKANENKSGDHQADIAARSVAERMAAKHVLAEVPLETLRQNPVVPYDEDEVTRVIDDAVNETIFNEIKGWTVGEFREWILDDNTTGDMIRRVSNALTGEMVAGVTKLMSNMDLMLGASKIRVSAHCNNTIGLPGTLASRNQPNHPTDSPEGIRATIYEGLAFGSGDSVIGINPVDDSLASVMRLLEMTYNIIQKWQAYALAKKHCWTAGPNFMYFETGQGSALSADAHHGADQLTLEARIYGMAKRYHPFQVNTVVGFIGPEYLYDSVQITRAGLEDHFMGKLTGISMGCDACYTNHARATQNDIENLAVLLTAAGCNYFMGVPMGDDAMLSYQCTSYHDAAALRQLLKLRPLPEFEAWMESIGLMKDGRLTPTAGDASFFLQR
jgi:ethanolamine ammonia-lyase large subunit